MSPHRPIVSLLLLFLTGAAAAQAPIPNALVQYPSLQPPIAGAPTPDAATAFPPTDDMAPARAAAARGDAAEALSRYLRVLATRPDDVAALAGAGQAALAVGDLNAASGFFARAEARAPGDGAVKAGIAATLVRQGDARGALRYFRAAETLGVAEATIAADRGLAYDLRGDPRRAQAEYAVALRARPGDAETVRRLATSQAIGGDRAAALATLDPLLRRQDVPAWRTRMFARAAGGDVAGASADAALILNAGQAAALTPYLARLATLRPAEKAAAVFLGRFPAARATTMAAAAPAVPSRVNGATISGSPAATVHAFADVPRPPPAPAEPPIAAPVPAYTAAAAPADASSVPDSPALRALQRRVAAARPLPQLAVPGGRRGGRTVAMADAQPGMIAGEASAGRAGAARSLAASPPADKDAGSSSAGRGHAVQKVQAAGEAAATRTGARRDAAAETAAQKAATDGKPIAKAKRPAVATGAAKKGKDGAADDRKTGAPSAARYWAQVAGGANRRDLPKAWAGLKAKWPKQLGARTPYTTHYRYTNRLLVGPFASASAAQDWVNEQRTAGLPAFPVTTAAGAEVEPVE